MGRTPSSDIRFSEDRSEEVVAAMAELARARVGWVNLTPEVEEGYEPPSRSAAAWLFSARGDAVPLATWTPAEDAGGRPTIGIVHGSGPRALERLAEAGLDRPASWLRMGDHPRRGLVLSIDPGSGERDVLDWLLEACHVLCDLPLTGDWVATVYRP
jgi:hypothetical protein